MRLVLHVGLPKSGTTALQTRFGASRRPLLRTAGILYPDGLFNHNFLAGTVLDLDSMPRLFRQEYKGNTLRFKADVERSWSAIVRSVERHRPKTILLSAESLCSRLGEESIERLRARLRSVADTVDAISYVRGPSDYYLSSAQQLLKASHRIKSVRAIPYRDKLESIASVADRMNVVAYDRSRFPDEDIALDFARRMIPEAETNFSASPIVTANATMSAEVMAALQDYRRTVHADETNLHTVDTEAFVKALTAVEQALGQPERPRLHPDVRDVLDHGSPDLVWLRDRFQLVFPGIDYDRIGERDVWRPARVDEICPVDENKRAQLIFGAIKAHLDTSARRPATFRAVRLQPDAGGRLGALRQWLRPAAWGR